MQDDDHAPRRLAGLNMESRLGKADYEERLAGLQTRLQRIQQAYLDTGDSAVVVFEGWDAAGKGGTIRLMSAVLDPRSFRVWPIAAPREHDLERHYLARFWERLPAKREIAVFDRSWYGRVLVERVEGFATAGEWKRAYREITDFERLLTDAGTRIAKIFLYITPDEQLGRFEKRMSDPLKRWKLSYEDFRNREKWEAYEAAADEMLERTDTANAPWTVIPANDKRFARIAALEVIADRLSDGIDLAPRELDDKVEKAFRRLMKAGKSDGGKT